MTRSIMRWTALVLVLVLSGACIPSGKGGPVAWIDQPLDGSTVPLGPLTITAHASSKAGVRQISFYKDFTSPAIATVNTKDLTLAEAEIEWTPIEPGEYVLWVQADDTGMIPGDPVLATIYVSEDMVTQLEVLPTKAPTMLPVGTLEIYVTPTLTFTPSASFTPTAAGLTSSPTATQPSPTPTGTFTPAPAAGAPTLLANSNANCRTGPGVAYPIDDGLHKGQVGIIEGRNADNSWVWIREPSGGGGHCWVSAGVGTLSGSLNLVLIIQAPPPPITVTPSKTAKAGGGSAPQVSIQIGDATLETTDNPCTNHPTTTSVTVQIHAAADLSKVVLHWSGVKSGSKTMQSNGGAGYKATLGAFSKAGNLSVWVTAVDENGAQGTSQTISVKITSGCGS